MDVDCSAFVHHTRLRGKSIMEVDCSAFVHHTRLRGKSIMKVNCSGFVHHTRLRGKSSLSLKSLYSRSRELLVIFFSTERLMSCSITFSFHSRVPLNF